MPKKKPGRKDEKLTEIIAALPRACHDETAAVEFIEARRWGGAPPACLRCGVVDPYMMKDAKTGARNRRYLWRCRECKAQFNCRTGTIFEDSKLKLMHWCRAFGLAAACKNGVSSLELQRATGCTAKTALFVLARLRYSMLPDEPPSSKLDGTIMADETFVGGKPRHPRERRAKWSSKAPVIAVLKPGDTVRAKHVSSANIQTVSDFIRANVEVATSRLMTDESVPYVKIGREFGKGHKTVFHSGQEYVRRGITVNELEAWNARLKRALYGTWHSVSKRRLGLYVAETAFRWNHRKQDDGARTEAIVRSTEGKRLTRKQYLARPTE